MYIIAGYGYVGSALHAAAEPHFPHLIIDPKHPKLDSWDLAASKRDQIKGVIVCVSTPQALDGRCDVGNVRDVLTRVARYLPTVPVLIKSTIALEAWDSLRDQFPTLDLTYSPEFLKAETAKSDFAEQSFIVFGSDQKQNRTWYDYFRALFPHVVFYYCTGKEAIMMKYASNCFLAVKVSFFNHIYDLCQQQGLDYNIVREMLSQRDDIGTNHMKVTEQRGWGGYCFPKDTAAMLHTCKLLGYDFSTLKAAVEYNWSIRRDILDTPKTIDEVVHASV